MKMHLNKRAYHVLGAAVIVFWLVMITSLVRRVHVDTNAGAVQTEHSVAQFEASSRENWMEIYLDGEKVGYSKNWSSSLKEGYLVEEEIYLKLNILGRQNTLHVLTRSVLDRAFSLTGFRFRMESGVVTFQAVGEVRGNRMIIDIGEGKVKTHRVIKLNAAPMTAAAIVPFLRARNMEVGERLTIPLFDPATLTAKEMELKATAREELMIRGASYPALKLEAELWGQEMTFWLDEKGDILKEEGFMGLTLVRSNAAKAAMGVEGSGRMDFAELAAVKTKGRLREPEKIAYLKLRAANLDDVETGSLHLDGGRQRFYDGVIEVVRETLPDTAPFRRPYEDAPRRLRPYLEPGPGIESEDEEIVRTALEVAGSIKDPAAASRELMEWVYKHLEKKPVISIPRAADVIRMGAGDCNEHAVLAAALLRASGIPARVATGLVYARGKFYYHAWNEVYLGDWVTLDATMNQMPADATHIKLVQGGLGEQMKIMSLVGKLGLEVLQHGYD